MPPTSIQETAGRATAAAGGAVGRGFGSILDRLPRRKQGQRTVTPASSRLETQRRAAIAVLAFVALALVLVFATSVVSFFKSTPGTLTSITAAQRAFEAAQNDLAQVSGSGIDLVQNDPSRAQQLLTDAWQQLAAAEAAGISPSVTAPLRAQAEASLNELYHMLSVSSTQAFSFANVTPPVDLESLVLGPDGAPYVLDAASKSVYRIDLKTGHAVVIAHQGEVVRGIKIDVPLFIATGGPDLLILDAKNDLWRWRPADTTGRGTIVKVIVRNSSGWGNDVRGIGTFLRNAAQGLYNLYVIDPSQRNILLYTPALDGSFPASNTGRLATAQDLSTVDAMLIDGDIYISENGILNRFIDGASQGWKPGDPGDEILRPAPKYTLLTTYTARDTGLIYAYDRANERIVAIDKDTGNIIEQYQLAGERHVVVRPSRDRRRARGQRRSGDDLLDRQDAPDELDPGRGPHPGPVGEPVHRRPPRVRASSPSRRRSRPRSPRRSPDPRRGVRAARARPRIRPRRRGRDLCRLGSGPAGISPLGVRPRLGISADSARSAPPPPAPARPGSLPARGSGPALGSPTRCQDPAPGISAK